MSSPHLQSARDDGATPDHSLESACTSEMVYDAVREAFHACGMADKYAALTMGMDPSQLSRALKGEIGLPVNRFARLGPYFCRQFVAAWGQALGLKVSSPDITRATLARLRRSIDEFEQTLEDR